jgi:hypothetical protein
MVMRMHILGRRGSLILPAIKFEGEIIDIDMEEEGGRREKPPVEPVSPGGNGGTQWGDPSLSVSERSC